MYSYCSTFSTKLRPLVEPEKLTQAKFAITNKQQNVKKLSLFYLGGQSLLQMMHSTWFCDAQDWRFPIKCVTYSQISDGCVKVMTDVARFTVPGAPIIHKIRVDEFQD